MASPAQIVSKSGCVLTTPSPFPSAAALPPSSPPPTPNNENSEFFYRMRVFASRGRFLLWAFPIALGLILMCCCAWWTISSHTMHEEQKELYVGFKDHVEKHGGKAGFLTTISDQEVEEATMRLRQHGVGRSV